MISQRDSDAARYANCYDSFSRYSVTTKLRQKYVTINFLLGHCSTYAEGIKSDPVVTCRSIENETPDSARDSALPALVFCNTLLLELLSFNILSVR